MLNKGKTIRAIVVDDSPTARELLVALLKNEQGIQVVGVGESGEDAIRLVKSHKPDILAMDVRMKGMDGLEATRRIMRESPLPIVLVTSSMMMEDTDLTFRALKAGALTVVRKPGIDDPDTCASLIQTIRVMAGLPVVHHWGRNNDRPKVALGPAETMPKEQLKALSSSIKIIAIASSTGGPAALAMALGSLPKNYPWPILIVQHVTPGFGLGLAQWLNTQTELTVRLAEHGDIPQPGIVLLAPDDYHMQVSRAGRIELIKGQPYKGLRPSANYMFNSLVSVFGANALGIILTGMGNDGAEGLEALFKAGGFNIAQDEKSCVVFGMPRAAIEDGSISLVLSIEEIAKTLVNLGALKNAEVSGE